MDQAPRRPTRLGRRFVAVGAAGALGLATVALGLAVLVGSDPSDEDPTRRGPRRFIRLDAARLEQRGDAATLVVRGSTNLVEGVRLQVAVLSGERELARYESQVRDGMVSLDAPGRGDVLGGSYEVAVRFALAEQTEAVRAALQYQPAWAQARIPLQVSVDSGPTVRAQLRDLVAAVTQLQGEDQGLEELEQRATQLHDRVWIGKEKLALQSVRLAIEEARRKPFDRGAFERLLLEAHVLAGP